MMFTKDPLIVSIALWGGTNTRNEESALAHDRSQGVGDEYGRASNSNWVSTGDSHPYEKSSNKGSDGGFRYSGVGYGALRYAYGI